MDGKTDGTTDGKTNVKCVERGVSRSAAMAAALGAFCLQFLGGCASEPEATAPAPVGPVACTEPRPQVCTMIYAPVCAEHRDGHRETHSSDCNACADATVVAHTEGPCEPIDNTVGTP